MHWGGLEEALNKSSKKELWSGAYGETYDVFTIVSPLPSQRKAVFSSLLGVGFILWLCLVNGNRSRKGT